MCGCVGPAPSYFPPAPNAIERTADGRVAWRFDTDRDGRADYCELARDGRVVAIRFESGPESAERGVPENGLEIPYPPEIADSEHLLIILDSVPFEMVRDLHRQGRFRMFYPPSRVISPFPVMTDVCLTEFFGVAPVPGPEASYVNGDTLTNSVSVYLRAENMPWLACVDYRLAPLDHAFAYTNPWPWYDRELHAIEQLSRTAFERGDDFAAYVVGTSALGSRYGRNGHQAALIRLERFCQSIIQQTRGRVHITLMSDHGHNLRRSRRTSLLDELKRSGYRVGKRLGPNVDAIVPEFGVVTCAAIYTRSAAAVARDATGFEGVELVAYLDESDGVVVLARGGRGRIERSADRFRYSAAFGDPLALLAVLDTLAAEGKVDADGFVSDEDWYGATVDHVYPDVLHRMWRAFHGLFVNTPDVLVSIEEGHHVGSVRLSNHLDMASTHGNLRRPSSEAFIMSTAAELPDALRMEELAGALRGAGVPVPQRSGGEKVKR